MTRAQAAIGSIVFFIVTPGVVAGLIPFWITGWHLPDPLPHAGIPAILGVVLLLPGLWVLIDSFVRFARAPGWNSIAQGGPLRFVLQQALADPRRRAELDASTASGAP